MIRVIDLYQAISPMSVGIRARRSLCLMAARKVGGKNPIGIDRSIKALEITFGKFQEDVRSSFDNFKLPLLDLLSTANIDVLKLLQYVSEVYLDVPL